MAKRPTNTTEASAKGAQMTALHTLVPIAREINVRIEKADKADDMAIDHRLAAALQLAKAREICDKSKVKFEDWCKENVTAIGYEAARKLVTVGQAKDPKIALLEMRTKNAEANKRARGRATPPAEASPVGPQASAGQASAGQASAGRPPNPSPNLPTAKHVAPENPVMTALATIKAQPNNVRENMAAEIVGALGLAIVPQEKARIANDPPEAAWLAFQALTLSQKEAFLEKAALSIGAHKQPKAEEDPLGLPSFLGGEDAKPVRKRRPKAS